MKNLKKAELAVIALTLLILIFTAGYFVGRGASVRVISFDKPAPPSKIVTVSPGPVSGIEEAGAAIVSVTDEPPVHLQAPASDTPAGSVSPAAAKININTAPQAMLELLPGIGPVLALNIIQYREEHGDFISIEQIMDVNGIGEKKFADMKDMITVGKG